jgi:hypothetical protein
MGSIEVHDRIFIHLSFNGRYGVWPMSSYIVSCGSWPVMDRFRGLRNQVYPEAENDGTPSTLSDRFAAVDHPRGYGC